ncbi:MAG: class II glutamine amidotransferase [Gammaproteobacteria bacterium]|nr:class II glutamine amidotransferase [Gammaproteobacteria bacterium]
MCRFAAYLGRPIVVDELLFKPSNSLIKQSIRARETDEPLNGDGFGLGWYAHNIDYTPAVFASMQPAWNDRNLQYLSAKIRTHCVFAHVRAASMGGANIFNCHPFTYKRFLFMHNGDIAGFDKIKRHIRHELSDDIYSWVKGQTDSEHFFGLFLQIFENMKGEHNTESISLALIKTIERLTALQKEHGIDDISYLNIAITDGFSVVASRYISHPEKPCPTLYYAAGSAYETRDGNCHVLPTKPEEGVEAVLLVSEKLTNYKAEWHEIPVNHLLLVQQDLSINLKEITLGEK